MERVRVAVVGGGRMGSPLITDLMSRPFVEMVAVCDVDTESSGARLARDNGIFVTDSVDELAGMGDDIDVIIEVSGDPEVKPRLKNAFVVSGNRTTIIMHDIIARMMMSIMGESDSLVETVHPDDRGIG
jgi:predicted homoserine dehydrogenase-like protein